ncbi:MAG: restriction endonuclease subunit S [Proteobacteria bacterium]|nr:restriction endonuclease subunit S [Pseudomonadota bacterium]
MSTASNVRIGDFCETGSGSTPPRDKMARYYDGGTIPWVKSGELRESIIDATEEHVTEAALKETSVKLVPANALLVAMYGATVGRLGILGVQATTNQAVCHIVPDPSRADVRYLYRALETKVSEMLQRTVGGAQPNINQGIVRDLRVPLPLLEEQRRIAAILDQAETLRTQRRQALAHLDTLTQSLFLDMFGDPVANDRGWPIASVGDFVAGFESGKSLVADDEDDSTSAYRVLKVSAVTSLEYKPEQSKAVPSDYVPPQSHVVRVGDLLFSRANTTELIGATAFVATTPDNLLLPDKLWRFVWHQPTRTSPLYVRHLFQQPKFRQEIGQRASGTSGSMKNISQEKVLSIRVGHPPLVLQQTFATRIQAIEALKATHRAALAQLDALFASLQQRAFAGELTAPTHAAAAEPPTQRSFAQLGQLDACKGIESLVYAAKRLPGKGHYWPTKVQYLADKRHLERYGRTIYGETHVAMPFGPVPQAAFNASRALAQGELISEFPMDVMRAALRREGDHLVALRDANMALLGAEERESLEWAIRYARDMNFEQLKTASHDAAWTKTAANAPIAWEDIIQTLPQAAQQRFFG